VKEEGDTMRKTVFIAVLTIGLFVIPLLIHAEVYKWIDEKGTIRFTDDHSNIPSSYWEQRKVEIREDIQEGKTSLEPQKTILGRKEARAKADLSRQEEEWWERKTHPWERQLEEASEDYELTDKEFMRESSNLILRKFGSHQQFKFNIIGMEGIKGRRSQLEAQIVEAEGMLEKISRAADQSRAGIDRLIGVLTPDQEDIYGSNEVWWREKLFTVRGKLEDAIQNYKRSYEEYSKNVERLSPFSFGRLSLTQYQLNSCRLEMLDSEMGKYQAQITEANEMLNTLLKEAKESKANPSE
jgi:hypothetical protein